MSAGCEQRRGTVILIQRGDPEISGAIARGMLEGKGTGNREQGTGTPSARKTAQCAFLSEVGPAGHEEQGTGGGECLTIPGEQIEIVTAEADRQKIVAQLVRVAVGNTNTPEDYRHMIVRARGLYATTRRPGPLKIAAGKLLLGWAMICQGVRRAYRAQDRVLRKE